MNCYNTTVTIHINSYTIHSTHRVWTGQALIHNLLEYLLVIHWIHKNNLDTM